MKPTCGVFSNATGAGVIVARGGEALRPRRLFFRTCSENNPPLGRGGSVGLSSELSMDALVTIGVLDPGRDASNRESPDGVAIEDLTAFGGRGGGGGGGGGGGLAVMTVEVAIEARLAAFRFAKNWGNSSALP